MSEDVSVGSKTEFLARIQRFTDEMLGSLIEGSRGKDVDEKEARALRSSLLKAMKIWENALHDGMRVPLPEDKLRRVENQASTVKTGEA